MGRITNNNKKAVCHFGHFLGFVGSDSEVKLYIIYLEGGPHQEYKTKTYLCTCISTVFHIVSCRSIVSVLFCLFVAILKYKSALIRLS